MISTESVAAATLRTYVGVVRRRLTVIVLCVAAVTAAALVLVSRQPARYEASARVLLQGSVSEEVLGTTPGAPDPETEIEVMRSANVARAVADALGHAPSVRMATVGRTDVVRVTARAATAQAAATDANTYANTYVAQRRQTRSEDLLAASTQLREKLSELDVQLDELTRPLRDLDTRLAATADPAERAALLEQRSALERSLGNQQRSITTRRDSYLDQLDRLQLANSLTVTGGAQVVSPAGEPSTPVSPRPLRTGALALAAGLVLGLALAVLVDQLDDRIRSREQLEAITDGLTTVGVVPAVRAWRKRGAVGLVTADASSSAEAEAYRSLRTSLQFIGLERPARVVQVTSPVAREGKTTTVANLAVSLARAGKRTVLVDCDLRSPRVHLLFGADNQVGLTSVLLGERPLAHALVPLPDHPGVALLPSGSVPPNPSELLALPGYLDVIQTLKAQADYVLLDSPPVLPVSDALIVSAVADATFLVVAAGVSRDRDVRRAVELLRQIDAPLRGTVLNRAAHEGQYGYGDYYGYGANRSRRALGRRGLAEVGDRG